MALATALSAPGTAIVVMAVIVAMIMVPAAVVPAMGPAVRVAAAGRRLLHKIHRLAAGVVACAMLAPVLGMAGRHVHVDGRTGHHHRRALDDDGLRVKQRWWRRVAYVDAAIHTGSQFAPHGGVDIGLRMGAAPPGPAARRQPRQKQEGGSWEIDCFSWKAPEGYPTLHTNTDAG